MKKLFLLMATVLTSLTAGAQVTFGDDDSEADNVVPYEDTRSSKVQLGLQVGGNYSMMSTYKDVDLDQKAGFGFRGGLVLSARFGKLTRSSDPGTGRIGVQIEPGYALHQTKMAGETLKLSYVECPILFRFFVTPTLSVDLGPNVACMVSRSPEEINADAANGLSGVSIKTGDLKGFDVKLAVGISYENAGGFFASARYNLGTSKLAGNFDTKLSAVAVSIGYKFDIFKF